jgi:vacuolar-type H+-ATPase subunit E/Vma4
MPAPAGPLLERLQRDADQAIAQLLAAAEQEATRVRDDASARRARQRAAAVSGCEADLARQREAARNAAEQSTVQDALSARAAFLDRVFERTGLLLEDLPRTADFAQRVAPLLADALPFVNAGELRVRCAPASADAVRAALAAAGAAGANLIIDDTIPAGAVVGDATDTVQVDATFAARMRRLRPVLSIQAARLIEAGEETP